MRIIKDDNKKSNERYAICDCGCLFAYTLEEMEVGRLDELTEGGFPYAMINCPSCGERHDVTYILYEEARKGNYLEVLKEEE